MNDRNKLFSRTDQIVCVKREIAMRKRVYPKFILNGRMKGEEADREIRCMESVLETLIGEALESVF